VRQYPPLLRAAGGIANPGGVVADDQDPGVALLLERAHALQRYRVSDVDVARRRVDSELDPKRPALGQLALELALGQHLHGVAGERGEGGAWGSLRGLGWGGAPGRRGWGG